QYPSTAPGASSATQSPARSLPRVSSNHLPITTSAAAVTSKRGSSGAWTSHISRQRRTMDSTSSARAGRTTSDGMEGGSLRVLLPRRRVGRGRGAPAHLHEGEREDREELLGLDPGKGVGVLREEVLDRAGRLVDRRVGERQLQAREGVGIRLDRAAELHRPDLVLADAGDDGGLEEAGLRGKFTGDARHRCGHASLPYWMNGPGR